MLISPSKFLLERKTKLHTLSTFVNFIIISSIKRKKLDLKRILKFIDMKKQNYTFELKTIVTQNTGVVFFAQLRRTKTH